MNTPYLLLMTVCLLFCLNTATVSLLAGLGHRYDQFVCADKGGTCNYSPCPSYSKMEGTCYNGKAKCCIRLF
ncbi:PREDICTED: beta-defensin 1 [Elephantulus edwardii]|uniref:beta-defensin 1 n=1 Tax=Elephantulus edwardii TaxID=28737 RepID=UPI0003F062D3|nr:PREDICTED: beta-defensin 1 [Elephantulus edwardii]